LPATASADQEIVLLRPGVDPARFADTHGLTPTRLYRALPGFAAPIAPAKARGLRTNKLVRLLTPDRPIVRTGYPNRGKDGANGQPRHEQVVPTGVSRVGGLQSPTAAINGVDKRVDADIAIVDDGADAQHPDLNVAGVVNCLGEPYKAGWHGTHDAATAAAIDNNFGTVGVAPGARIWSVAIFPPTGPTTLEIVLCGLDWIVAHADTLDVASMSAGFEGFDDPNCGVDPPDPVHAAICTAVAGGVTWIASAGNDSADTATTVPAAYDEVIAVSALADYDGRPGGLAEPTCRPFGVFIGADDTFATFSNFGADVDLMAPGACILSAWENDGYGLSSGTSMAAPHVAGAAALYRAVHPAASPAEVKAALLAAREQGHVLGDPDGLDEGVLNVASL
jgi:subtilisin